MLSKQPSRMSLARAFTSRRAKESSTDTGNSDDSAHKTNTTPKRHALPGSLRKKISSPMELTHTTNLLAYNAPDLYPQSTSSQASSPTQSSKSDDESCLEGRSTAMSSPPTSPEMSTEEQTCEPNHLSCYFNPSAQKSASSSPEAPAIPKRAPSHTKKASFDNFLSKHARFSNQSGVAASTKASSMMSRASSASTLASSVSSGPQLHKSSVPKLQSAPTPPIPSSRRTRDGSEPSHPFGPELAQVSELAEELGVKDKLQGTDEEERQIIAQGLRKFTAADYLAEIDDLISDFMSSEPALPEQPIWI